MSESKFAAQALIKQTVTYLDLVSASLLVYDYFLTLGEEITLVWPTRWNIGKALYFLTRYPAFIDTSMVLVHQFSVLTPGQCGILFRAIGWMLGVGIGIAEVILTMRTCVIWGRNRRIAIFLVVALIAFWVPVFWFLNDALSSLVFTTPPVPGTPGCFLLTQKDVLFAVFVLIMGFETLILGLTLLKGVSHFKQASSTLVVILYRDGLLNYIYLFILSVVNVIVLLTAPKGYTTLLTALQRVMHAILSSRILLHLRAATRPQNQVYQLKPTGPFLTRVFRQGEDTNHVDSGFEFAHSAPRSPVDEMTFGDMWGYPPERK